VNPPYPDTAGVRPALSIFEHFRSFWREVELLRETATARTLLPPADAGPEELAHVPTAIRERLLAFLQAQEADISRWAKGAPLEVYRQAEYVMVAVADEVFVHWSWSGSSYWSANLLETARFGTRRAGEAVFARIERLGDNQHPAQKELAAVYLAALALGFQGRYAGRSDRGAIERYKRQLYRIVFETQPDMADPFRRVMPTCYESTMAVGAGRRLRSPRLWWWAAAAVITVWLVASHVMWTRLTGPLYRDVPAIMNHLQGAP
jgi:type VI secretion system protein ImpK